MVAPRLAYDLSLTRYRYRSQSPVCATPASKATFGWLPQNITEGRREGGNNGVIVFQ